MRQIFMWGFAKSARPVKERSVRAKSELGGILRSQRSPGTHQFLRWQRGEAAGAINMLPAEQASQQQQVRHGALGFWQIPNPSGVILAGGDHAPAIRTELGPQNR